MLNASRPSLDPLMMTTPEELAVAIRKALMQLVVCQIIALVIVSAVLAILAAVFGMEMLVMMGATIILVAIGLKLGVFFYYLIDLRVRS